MEELPRDITASIRPALERATLVGLAAAATALYGRASNDTDRSPGSIPRSRPVSPLNVARPTSGRIRDLAGSGEVSFWSARPGRPPPWSIA